LAEQKKKKYRVWGHLPGLGFVREYVWAYSQAQAMKLVNLRLQKRFHGKGVVVPPAGLHLQIEEIPT